jgi:hypothetical protein
VRGATAHRRDLALALGIHGGEATVLSSCSLAPLVGAAAMPPRSLGVQVSAAALARRAITPSLGMVVRSLVVQGHLERWLDKDLTHHPLQRIEAGVAAELRA